MSALLSPTTTTTRRPALRGVSTAAKPMGGLSFLLVLAAILGVGMIGVLMLNTQIQNQGFEVNELNARAAANTEEVAALNTQLNALSSSSELMRRATDLGMIPNAQPGYLNVATGVVSGEAKPASQGDVPRIKSDRTRLEEAARAKQEAEAKAKAEAEAKAKADAEAAAAAAGKATPAPSAPAPSAPAAPTKKA